MIEKTMFLHEIAEQSKVQGIVCIGFEDVKVLFEMAIKAERPVHLLLCGPPSSGKLLFMSSLTKLEKSYYAVGSSSTKSGIFDYLFEYRPRYFIIDELEK